MLVLALLTRGCSSERRKAATSDPADNAAPAVGRDAAMGMALVGEADGRLLRPCWCVSVSIGRARRRQACRHRSLAAASSSGMSSRASSSGASSGGRSSSSSAFDRSRWGLHGSNTETWSSGESVAREPALARMNLCDSPLRMSRRTPRDTQRSGTLAVPLACPAKVMFGEEICKVLFSQNFPQLQALGANRLLHPERLGIKAP